MGPRGMQRHHSTAVVHRWYAFQQRRTSVDMQPGMDVTGSRILRRQNNNIILIIIHTSAPALFLAFAISSSITRLEAVGLRLGTTTADINAAEGAVGAVLTADIEPKVHTLEEPRVLKYFNI